MFRPRGQDKDFFKELLKKHGDSLLIAGDAGLFHLHIHTDSPEGVESELVRHGEIVSRKVDSLRKPEEPAPEIAVALLMDSAVDIPEQTEKALGIAIVPLQILLNDRYFRDKVEIGKEELYRRMRSEKDLVVKTSQPAPLDFKTAYETALARQRQALFFSLSSRLERFVSERVGGAAASASRRSGQDPHHRHAQCLGRQRPAPVPRPAAPAAGAETLNRSRRRSRPVRDDVVSLGYVESLEYAVRGGRLPPLAGVHHPPAGDQAAGGF